MDKNLSWIHNGIGKKEIHLTFFKFDYLFSYEIMQNYNFFHKSGNILASNGPCKL